MRLSRAQRCPVDLDTGRPQLAEREQEGVPVIGVLNRVAHEPNGAVPARPLRVPYRRAGQAAAGADLDKDPARIGQHHIEFVGEPDRGADLARPGGRVGGLLLRTSRFR